MAFRDSASVLQQHSRTMEKFPTQESVGHDDNKDMCTSPTQESSRGLSTTATSHQLVPSPGLPLETMRMYQDMTNYNNVSPVHVGTEEEITHYDIGSLAGYATLICNDHIPEHRTPLPVHIDFDLIANALCHCEWVVEKLHRHSSMSLKTCETELSLLVSKDYSNYSCFIVYYSGHGNSKGLLLSDGRCMPYADIVRRVSSINSLFGKPKIFIFDSCRIHNKEKSSWNFSRYIHKVHSENEAERDYPPADTLICYSTNEGMKGWSHDNEGSFYTQELAKKVKMLWKRLSFTEIVTLTHGWTTQLAQQYKKEQRPVMYNALSRLLLLGGKFSTCIT